jgi:hypothetical protein
MNLRPDSASRPLRGQLTSSGAAKRLFLKEIIRKTVQLMKRGERVKHKVSASSRKIVLQGSLASASRVRQLCCQSGSLVYHFKDQVSLVAS